MQAFGSRLQIETRAAARKLRKWKKEQIDDDHGCVIDRLDVELSQAMMDDATISLVVSPLLDQKSQQDAADMYALAEVALCRSLLN
jgi:hypothetical protein